MLNDVTVFNIREYLSAKDDKDLGEDELRQILSEFFCDKNPDVERFLREQSIEFTKKNQSVTYLVFSNDDASLVGYFTLTVKPITVNAENFSNTLKRKIARVSELDEENGTYTLLAYLIAQLGKNYKDGLNEKITGEQLLQAAIETIKELQYMVGGNMVGGMVIFLEAENKEKLMCFYEDENGFKRFDTKEVKVGTENAHVLVQLLKIL
nr:GNAT family acetyltransferase [uncultured Lachnoclostridium sp.]